MAPRKRREFTAEQKAEAVQVVKKVGNLAQVARDLDLHPNVLRKWVKQAEIDAGKGPAEALHTEAEKANFGTRLQLHDARDVEGLGEEGPANLRLSRSLILMS